jgi:hypothetical protein
MSLAIESGATSSSVVYIPDGSGKNETLRFRLGPANFCLMTHNQLSEYFREIKSALKGASVRTVGIGMPGILNEKNKNVWF